MQSNGKFVRTSVSNPIRGEGLGAPRRRNKGLRVMRNHVSTGGGLSWAGYLVQRKRKNKGLRESLHQIRNGKASKKTKNLVQEKRKNKGLREFLHQVRRIGAPKRAKDLVQEKRKNKVLRESLHQVRSRGAAPPPEPDAGNPPLCAFSDPDPLFSRNERSRCTKCTAASSLYFAFFGVASSKAAPSPLVRRPQVRRSPFRLGNAPSARQRPTNAAKPSPARPASPAHPAPTSAALGCVP